jgi:hypothetical protein
MIATARNAAMVLGLVFLIVGVLGFVPNPIVSPTGVFVVDNIHNCVHVGSGILLLIGAYASAGTFGPSLALKLVGIAYAIIAIFGFVMPGDMPFGMLAMNTADNWLHVVLAAVLLYAGFGLATERGAAVA